MTNVTKIKISTRTVGQCFATRATAAMAENRYDGGFSPFGSERAARLSALRALLLAQGAPKAAAGALAEDLLDGATVRSPRGCAYRVAS